MTHFSLEIPITGDVSKIWVVFTHSHDDHVFFLGYTQLKDFLVKPTLQLHPGWSQYMREIKPTAVKVDAEVLYSARDAMLRASELFKKFGLPREMYCNPYQDHYRHCIIKCLETGDMFATAKEAAKWAGVDPSQMSFHLSRRSGYPTIKGNTFVKEIRDDS